MSWARKNIFELNQKQKHIEPLCTPGLLSIPLLRNVQACTEQTGTVAVLQGHGGERAQRKGGFNFTCGLAKRPNNSIPTMLVARVGFTMMIKGWGIDIRF